MFYSDTREFAPRTNIENPCYTKERKQEVPVLCDSPSEKSTPFNTLQVVSRLVLAKDEGVEKGLAAKARTWSSLLSSLLR